MRWIKCLHEVGQVSTWGGSSVYMRWVKCLHEVDQVSTWGGSSVYMRWIKCLHEVDQVSAWGGSSVYMRWVKCLHEVDQVSTWGGSSVLIRWVKCLHEVDQVSTWGGSSSDGWNCIHVIDCSETCEYCRSVMCACVVWAKGQLEYHLKSLEVLRGQWIWYGSHLFYCLSSLKQK